MTGEGPIVPTDGAVRLVLARHGQTPSNVRHLLDTLPPGPALNETGLRQADDLADRLTDEPIASVHASRALRAQQTAGPVAARHGLDVGVLDGMQEIYVGEFEGSGDPETRARFEDIYANWHIGKLDDAMPGGETGWQALTRFFAAVRHALAVTSSGSAVLVSHGAMLRLAAGYLATNVDAQAANAAYLPNTGLIILDPTPDGWYCTQWDGLEEG